MQMTRTSLFLPSSLHQRLLETARQRGQSVSEVVRGFLEPMLHHEENKRLDEVYNAFRNVQGLCKDPITDASTSIDQVLYGGQGTQEQV